jgi:hypothetical protein
MAFTSSPCETVGTFQVSSACRSPRETIATASVDFLKIEITRHTQPPTGARPRSHPICPLRILRQLRW